MSALAGRRFAVAGILAALAMAAGVYAKAESVARPEFSRTLAGPPADKAVETAIGQWHIAAVGRGLANSADPTCKSAQGLGPDAYEALGRLVITRVGQARDNANATGLDAKAADAAYIAAMGSARMLELEKLVSGTDAASKNFRYTLDLRQTSHAILEQADALLTAFNTEELPLIRNFANATFDGAANLTMQSSISNAYDHALAQLPAQAKEALHMHRRASSDAWTKATDMMKANRLSGRDVFALVKDDLAKHCIRR